MTTETRSLHTAAVLEHIRDRFYESKVDDAIWINCPVTGKRGYEIYPEGGRQPAGYYIAIDGNADERDPKLNNIATLEAAKAEVAERIAQSIEEASAVIDAFHRIAGHARMAA